MPGELGVGGVIAGFAGIERAIFSHTAKNDWGLGGRQYQAAGLGAQRTSSQLPARHKVKSENELENTQRHGERKKSDENANP